MNSVGPAAKMGVGGFNILGCVVLGFFAVLAIGLCGVPTSGLLDKKLETDKQKAIADARAAEAVRLAAEAEKALADAQAVALKDYSEVAKYAIRADTRRAHPELILADLLPYVCAAVAGIIVAFIGIFLYLRYIETPKETDKNAR